MIRQIEIPRITDFSGINYFVGGNENKQVCTINCEDFRQTFKKLTIPKQLDVLFQYMKDRSDGGLYKKEGNRTIGEYFGVGKDLIGDRLKRLEEAEKIFKLSELDKYYKLKECY